MRVCARQHLHHRLRMALHPERWVIPETAEVAQDASIRLDAGGQSLPRTAPFFYPSCALCEITCRLRHNGDEGGRISNATYLVE